MSPLSFSLVHTQASTKESIYPNHIPDFVASALDDLYGNVYASLATLKSTNLCRTNTYVKWIVEGHQQHPEAIFLFQKNEHAIRVVTEGMRLKKEEVDCFCNFIFNYDKDINRIDFHAVAPPRESLGGNISSKRSALGVREKLAHLTVYRSSADILRYPKTTLQLATNALAYHIHCWIEDQSSKPENSVAGRLINSLRRWIRACRRMAKPSLPSAVAR